MMRSVNFIARNSHLSTRAHVVRALRPQSTISRDGVEVEEAVEKQSGIANRLLVTAEVTASKIFPAGFGWQFGSVLAANAGLTSDSLGFALATGAGDFTGVFLGHTLFYSLKHTFFVQNPSESLSQTASTGLFLASAAYCSGSVWQPVVNLLQAGGLSFVGVTAVTTTLCAGAFFAGLRGGRVVYPTLGLAVAPASYKNLKNDASLSLAIGGAGGGFVGTDINYLPGQNFLKDLVGVDAADSVSVACTKAGSATSLGFLAVQSVQNVGHGAGKNWTD